MRWMYMCETWTVVQKSILTLKSACFRPAFIDARAICCFLIRAPKRLAFRTLQYASVHIAEERVAGSTGYRTCKNAH